MKKTTPFKLLFFLLLFATQFSANAQNFVPFTTPPGGSQTLKGDMLQIGNNIINRRTNTANEMVPYNDDGNNNSFDNYYVDIDSDPSTFSSSSADLVIPARTTNCYRIAYAALYWSGSFNQAAVTNGSVILANLTKVKFKTPGGGGYTDLTGTMLFNSYPTPLSSDKAGYVAKIDVTTILQGLANANGTYTVANVISQNGSRNLAAGWSLYVVYEDPLASAKYITLFDGFSAIGSSSLNIPISGFTSIPVGPVRAKVAFSTTEGDRNITGDQLRINGVQLATPQRPGTNFFNSTINDINGPLNARNLNSSNTLGYDAGILNIPNASNSVIANGATSCTIQLRSTGDAYYYFLNAFSIEVIQPQINLIKTVKNMADVNIGNGNVVLGQELYYDLEFNNIGNDNATGFTITDNLPVNVNFLPGDLILPPGVTYTYSGLPANQLVFTIPNSLVTQGSATYKIRIKVKVVETCNELRDACSNDIRNQAFKTYSSQNSGNIVENGQPSASGISACLIPEPGTTNFLVGIDGCTYEREEVLCGANVTLTAGSGYLSYQWHNGSPATAANAIPGAINQSYSATATGVYSVVNTAPAPCLTITETITVVDFSGVVPNPVIPFADEVVNCVNDGSVLPKIYLCGTTDAQLIQTNILNATLIWERLVEGSCTPIGNANCPNRDVACTWNQVGTGPTFNANSAGQYRVRISFQNGCSRDYYFNVYQNLFTPTATHTDVICGTLGTITVNGVPANYEYTINGVDFQDSNVFENLPVGTYIVATQPKNGGVGSCLFSIPNITIFEQQFTVDVIPTNALCNGGQGQIRVQANNVAGYYIFELLQGTTLINSTTQPTVNDFTFVGLNPGTYIVNVETEDGCTYTETVTITEPPVLSVTAGITKPLTCEFGQITIYPVGGTAPYIYQVSSFPDLQATPVFDIDTPGTYTITVTDFNNCVATTTITIDQIPPPVFTVTSTDVLCYGSDTGTIVFNVTNSNGYTILYSIDDGNNYQADPSFTNLAAGTYQTLVQYTLNGVLCTTTAQDIIITQPATALTASMGVSELAGCGPGGEGKVRITNPQGGVPGYQYSFNGGITWGALNEAYLPPGTYSICIRDVNLCTFCSTVIIDPAPQDPTIVVNDPDFNCDGTATTTVTVNAGVSNFEYTYLIDDVVNTNVPPNVFVNVPCGPHNIKIQYKTLDIPTYSNLLFEDFGLGIHTTSPGINPAYCFERQVVATQCNGSTQINDGDYAVLNRINPRFGTWVDALDHTSNGTNPNGRFLCVNIGGTAGVGGILYSKPIVDIIPNQNVQVSVWAMNLLGIGTSGFDPNLTIQLVKDLGLPTQVIIASEDTGNIAKSNIWENYVLSLNPGNNTNLDFVIRSNITELNGNDVVIDDINVFQEPVACITEVIYPINVACNQAFTAEVTSFSDVTCNGANDGQITITATNFDAAGFYYSLDNGTNWVLQATSPLVLTGLGASTLNVLVQYDLSATPCSFPISQVISQPNALISNATIISPATCLVGATIQASATGGTPNYLYQLEDDLGNIIVAYQSNNTFSNQPAGNYIIRVKDSKGCTDPIDTVLVVPVAPTPTATITSNLCIGTAATFITVNATGGTAPYEYSLNGGTFVTTDTFNNLPAGTYNIIVRDSFGCTYTVPTLIVAPQLTANVSLTSGLDCTASPDASISGTVNGGTAPYTYQVSFNAGTPTPAAGTTIVGNTFTYSTSVAGNYVFTITDATGCASTTTQITVNPLPILNPPTVTVLTNSICNGDTNGSISIVQNGGQGPFVIEVFNTTTSTPYGVQTSGLPAGNYTVTITDANFCTATTNVTITQPDPVFFDIVKTDIQCGGTGTDPGSILVQNVNGGTAPYTYTLTNTEGFVADYNTVANEDYDFTILEFGIYTLTVRDVNGCLLVQNSINMASPPNSLNIDISTATADCTTGGTIIVTVTPVVAGGPYHFAIYTGAPYPTYPNAAYQDADVVPGGLSSTFTGLTPGTVYSFIVYDESTNCYYFQTAPGPVPTLSTIAATATPNNVTCTGAADGSVNFTFSNYSGTSVSYQVFSALTNAAISPLGTSAGLTGAPVTISNFGGPLAPGTYYILFTENNGAFAGCSQASANLVISQSPVLLSLVATVTKNDNCNTNAGQITVTASNGTPGYTYVILPTGSPAPTVLTWTGQASNVFNVEGGTYDIYVKDAYNCIQMVTAPVVPVDTVPEIALTLVPTTLCNTVDGNYSIRVIRTAGLGVAPFTYSVDAGGFTSYTEDASNSFVITNLNSGTHTVIIRDVNGCEFTQSITILPPVNGTATATIAATANCGVSDGIITVSPLGGSGNYTYSIAPNPAVINLAGNVFSNVPAGTYNVTITDNTTTCTFVIPVTITAPTPVTFTTVSNAVSCNGGSNGSIIVTLGAGNNNPPYTYQIAGAVNATQVSNNVFNNLPAGAYVITVTSERGCVSTENVTVFEPAVIVVPAPTVTEFACNAGTNSNNNATITVTGVTGGSGTYINYQFAQGGITLQSGSSNTYTEGNPLGGTYTITVTDNNGCTGFINATIAPYIRLNTISVTKDVAITCTNDESITINVTTLGGTPAVLNYTVIGVAPNTYNVTQTSPSFTGLTVGNYNITVTNPVTGCTIETVHYVFEPNTFDLTFSAPTTVTCFGGSDGTIAVTFIDLSPTPTNDAGAFTYTAINQNNGQVVNGTSINAGPITLTGLSAGTWEITAVLTNTPNCTVTKTFTIAQPTTALALNVTNTPITCTLPTSNDGSITATASFGWGAPYEYQLENGGILVGWSAQNSFPNLGVGTYTIRARDSKGCEVITTVTLSLPTAITGTIAASTTLLPCLNDTTAVITVSGVSGGSGTGYTYILFNTITGNQSGPQSNNVFTNIGAGTYYVEIRDSFNCVVNTNTITIAQPLNNVTASLTTNSTLSCLVNAELLLTATGGTPPYQYSTSQSGPFVALPAAGQTFSVGVGTYQYFVRDFNNCITVVSNSVQVTPIETLTIAINTTNAFISCVGETTSFTASATGGLGNYVYTLNPPVATSSQNPIGTFNNVPAGTYTVTVTSDDCTATSTTFTLTEPAPFDPAITSFTDVTCNGENNGTISVLVTGGTGIIQYSISPPTPSVASVNSGVFTDLAPGIYTVYVQDQNGCESGPYVFPIAQPQPLDIAAGTLLPVNENCINEGSSISFTIIGGTAGYTTTATGLPTQTSATGQFSYTNLTPGEYEFAVTDDNGCQFSFNYTFNPGIDIQALAVVTYDCVANAPANMVTVEYNTALNLADLSFVLDAGTPQIGNNVFTNVATGNHTITVTHIPSGCIVTTTVFNIVATTSPVLTLTESGLNQFTASTTGGSLPYTYEIDGVFVGSQTVFPITQTGTYEVTVTDANGCYDTKTIFMEFKDVEIPNFFTPNGDGNNDGWSPLYADNFPNIVSYVYDRYGREVAKLRIGDSWDGTYNNKELPTGDYWYVVKLNGESDAREYVGHFTLYR